MPTITAQSIIDKAKITLQDTTGVRWPDSELLAYLNDGQREVCIKRPDAVSVLANVTLTTGTRQTIPDAGTAILRAVRNMGTNGTTPGRAIRHVSLDLLDSNIPNWHAAAPSAEVLHVAVDVRMPQHFYVYPPATSGTQIEVLYAAPPAVLVSAASVISVDDVFATPLYDYLCFRAYTKDQDSTGNAERAKAHRDLFDGVMDSKAQADAAMAPSRVNTKG